MRIMLVSAVFCSGGFLEIRSSYKVKRHEVCGCELARWTIEESDQRGLSRREWRPFSGRVAEDDARGVAEDDASSMSLSLVSGAFV